MEGSVKWFNRKKGFGFINGDDGEDYFVHHTSITQGTFIRDNDKVSFDAVETERGKQAQNVVLLQKGSEIEGQPAEEGAVEEAPAEEAPAEEQPIEEEPVEEEKPVKEKKAKKKKSKK